MSSGRPCTWSDITVVVKEQVKSIVKYDNEKAWGDHIHNLVKQGNLLELAKSQHTDLTWKSYIFNLKKGTLKFILNAILNFEN